MKWLTIVPAYGRDYKSKREVQESWERGEDWIVADAGNGKYINKDDVVPEGIILHARYKKMERIHEIKR